MTQLKASVSSVLIALLAHAGSTQAVITTPGKQIDYLNRGAVAIKSAAGVFICWRQLATDAPGTTFNVYRGATRLNSAPLDGLNTTDAAGTAAAAYSVRPVIGGVEQGAASAGATWANPYLSIPVQTPPAGVTKAGEAYTY